jgi:hypothetical protein
MMPVLLVRAHETDTNAWYPVAPTQPRASAVRRQRRSINAHQQCREEEQLRAASKSAKEFCDGKRTRNESDGTSMKGCKQFNARGKYSGSCEGRDGHPKIRTKPNLSQEGQSFLRNRRQKGRDSAVTVPAPYRPTGARLRPGPVLTIP